MNAEALLAVISMLGNTIESLKAEIARLNAVVEQMGFTTPKPESEDE